MQGQREPVLEDVNLNDQPSITSQEPSTSLTSGLTKTSHLHHPEQQQQQQQHLKGSAGGGPALVFSEEALSSSSDDEEADERTILFERGAGRVASPPSTRNASSSSSSSSSSSFYSKNSPSHRHEHEREDDEHEEHHHRDGGGVILIECPVCRRRFAVDFVQGHARGCLEQRLDESIREAKARRASAASAGDRPRASTNPPRGGHSNIKRQTGPPQPIKKHDPKSSSVGSFFSSFNRMIDDIAKDFNVGLEKLTQTIETEFDNYSASGEKQFQKDFNLAPDDALLGGYGCKVLNGHVGVSGTSYISTHHFCFCNSQHSIRIVIPLVTIVKIQKAVEVKQKDRTNEGPVFRAVPLDARGDCLQLFTNDRRVHSFYSDFFSFGPMHHHVANFQRFFDLVMDTWQAAVRRQQDESEEKSLTAEAGAHPSAGSPDPAQNPSAARESVEEDDDEEEEVLLGRGASSSNRVGGGAPTATVGQAPAAIDQPIGGEQAGHLPPPLQPSGSEPKAEEDAPKFTLE